MSVRRSAFAAVLLPLLFLTMVGSARANVITVNSLDGGSEAAPLCTLTDAVTAANSTMMVNGCAPGSGNDTIVFNVSGTIMLQSELRPLNTLSVIGPTAGGIAINGSAITTRSIFLMSGGSLSLKNLTLEDCASHSNGPAINAIDAQVDIENCSFIGNTALGSFGNHGQGGALSLTFSSVTIVNSTFANNTADNFDDIPGLGGAIVIDGANLAVTNSTFFGNSAGNGAALGQIFEDGGNINLRGTILADSVLGMECFAEPVDDSYNADDDGSCGFSSANHSLSDNKMLNLDSMGPLHNGGPTETVALEAGSTAIGLDKDCVDQATPPNTILTDQRLFIRPDSPTECDSGAYEHDGEQGAITEVPGTERLQVALAPISDSSMDLVNLALSFYEDAPCMGANPLADGLIVQLYEGTCSSMTGGPIYTNLSPFTVYSVNHVSYGTLFQSIAPETVSARMTTLPTPLCRCGEWNLNLELTGLDTMTSFGMAAGNPFALVLTDASGAHSGCINIDNAIVGSQIDPPKRTVRRAVRR